MSKKIYLYEKYLEAPNTLRFEEIEEKRFISHEGHEFFFDDEDEVIWVKDELGVVELPFEFEWYYPGQKLEAALFFTIPKDLVWKRPDKNKPVSITESLYLAEIVSEFFTCTCGQRGMPVNLIGEKQKHLDELERAREKWRKGSGVSNMRLEWQKTYTGEEVEGFRAIKHNQAVKGNKKVTVRGDYLYYRVGKRRLKLDLNRDNIKGQDCIVYFIPIDLTFEGEDKRLTEEEFKALAFDVSYAIEVLRLARPFALFRDENNEGFTPSFAVEDSHE